MGTSKIKNNLNLDDLHLMPVGVCLALTFLIDMVTLSTHPPLCSDSEKKIKFVYMLLSLTLKI